MSENKQWACPNCGVGRFHLVEGECQNCGTIWADALSLPKQDEPICEECEMPAPVHTPFCRQQEPDGLVQEIPREIMDWIEAKSLLFYEVPESNKPSNYSSGAIAMYKYNASEIRNLKHDIEYRDRDLKIYGMVGEHLQEQLSTANAQIEALKEELILVRHFRDNITDELNMLNADHAMKMKERKQYFEICESQTKEIELLKKELSEVYNKIDDLHKWHISHI
jgi:hypothetical protein